MTRFPGPQGGPCEAPPNQIDMPNHRKCRTPGPTLVPLTGTVAPQTESLSETGKLAPVAVGAVGI